jgi:hypothetical protein
MDAPTDPAKLRAVLERLEAEESRRRAEKVEAGELVSIPLFIVAGSEAEARIRAEEAKTEKLAELHAAGDQREVSFSVTLVRTGVVRSGEVADEGRVPSAPSFLPATSPPPVAVKSVALPRNEDGRGVPKQEEPQPPLIETYIAVQTRRCHDDDDPGEVAEGYYSIAGKVVTVTDAKGRYVGSRTMLEGEDARAVAKQLLREKAAGASDFNTRRIDYPASGLA